MRKVLLIILLWMIAITPSDVKAYTVELTAVGDIMLDRKVKRVCGGDYFYPFSKTQHFFKKDIAFGNLETSISDRGRPLPGKGIWFRTPPEAATALKQTGFDVVSIANNHILDYDTPALMDTIYYLEKASIKAVGAGENLEKARRGTVLRVKGYDIAFLAYTDFYDIFWSRSYPRCFSADEDTPGVAPLNPDLIREDVEKHIKQCDFVIVSLHWGTEGSLWPSVEQRKLAHDIIDWGADAIIGHHPHVLQGIEIYNNKPIFYSLGNFVFDQPWQENRQSVIAVMRFVDYGISGIDLIPVLIKDCRPEPVEGKEAQAVIQRLKNLSKNFNSRFVIRENFVQLPLNQGVKAKLVE